MESRRVEGVHVALSGRAVRTAEQEERPIQIHHSKPLRAAAEPAQQAGTTSFHI